MVVSTKCSEPTVLLVLIKDIMEREHDQLEDYNDGGINIIIIIIIILIIIIITVILMRRW